jgi:nitroreductase
LFRDLVLQNRSFRRFHQEPVTTETLRELIDLARCSASSGNRQALKYILSNETEKNAVIFQLINLVGPNRDVRHPPEGERPTAYIIVLGDKEIREAFAPDHGIAAQSILLGAREKGLGGCMIGIIRRDQMMEALKLPSRYQILMVIALRRPMEEVRLEKAGPEGKTMFWWDESGIFHVPKRALDDIIIGSCAPPG